MNNFIVTNQVLPNGLRFIHINNPFTKAFEITLHVCCGSRDEKRNESGIAHFLEHMLFRGSKNYQDSFKLSNKLESFGGEANATTSLEMTTIWLRGEQSSFEEALACFYEFVNFPNYSDIETERSIILEEMASDYNDAGVNIDIEFRSMSALFPHSSLGRSIIGNASTCKSISSKKLENFRKNFYSFDNCILSVISRGDPIEIIKNINELFTVPQKQTSTFKNPIRKAPIFKFNSIPKVLCISNLDNQFTGRLSFAFKPLTQLQHVAMSVLQRFMDDGISSHLPSNLREKLGLVYDINCEYINYSDFSLFHVDFTVSENNIESFLLNFFRLFNLHFLNDGHIQHIKKRYLFDLDTSLEHPSNLLNREIFNLTCKPIITHKNEKEILGIIEIKDINFVFDILKFHSNTSFVLIGPKAKKHMTRLKHAIDEWKSSCGERTNE